MLHLEYRLDEEAFGVAVVSPESEHFADDAARRVPLDVDDEVDGFSDLRFGVGEGGLGMAAHDQIGESLEGLLCRVGMNRGQRTGMASVEGIEQGSGLDATHFTEN